MYKKENIKEEPILALEDAFSPNIVIKRNLKTCHKVRMRQMRQLAVSQSALSVITKCSMNYKVL